MLCFVFASMGSTRDNSTTTGGRQARPPLSDAERQRRREARCRDARFNPRPPLSAWQKVGYKKADWSRSNFWSQYKQDHMLWTEHYALQQQPPRRRRMYVDIGTNDAEWISNTYFFDACAGWDGICVEANWAYIPSFAYRRCAVVSAVVSSAMNLNVTFRARGSGGGIISNETDNDGDGRGAKLTYSTVTIEAQLERVSSTTGLSMSKARSTWC